MVESEIARERKLIERLQARLEALVKANAAPRCGARSKRTGKPCRAAAMPNGRCKLHGGKSTGPRTPEGLERSRRANWKHGHFSREAKAERSRVRAARLRSAICATQSNSRTRALRKCPRFPGGRREARVASEQLFQPSPTVSPSGRSFAPVDIGKTDIHDHEIDLPGLGGLNPFGPVVDRDRLKSSCNASCSTSASHSSKSSSTIRILRVFVIPRPQDRDHPGTAFARNRAFGAVRS